MKKIVWPLLFIITVLVLFYNLYDGKKILPKTSIINTAMKLESSAFKEGEMIPSEYTCEGLNTRVPLSWSEVPEGVKSFAIIVDDPDAPSGDFVHWLIFNIPLKTTELPENGEPAGAVDGINSANRVGWIGPCPPTGTHHYHFKLYALDTKLTLTSEAKKSDLLSAMESHVLAEAELVGLYKKSK